MPGLFILTLIAFAVCLALVLDLRRRMDRLERQVRHLRNQDVVPGTQAQAPATAERLPSETDPARSVAEPPPPPRKVPTAEIEGLPTTAPEPRPFEERVAPVGDELLVEPPAEPSADTAAAEPPIEAEPQHIPEPWEETDAPVIGLRERRPAERELPKVKATAAFDLESFLGGRVFLVAGVIAVLLALGFFFKYAIDQGLIDKQARVAMGGIAGLAAVIGGFVLHGRGHRIFGHGLMGGGVGALYLSVFYAADFDLLGAEAAFGATALITAAAAALAIWKNGPHLAWLGFLGGFLAPAILSTGKDALEGLAGWLVVLDLGILAVTWKRRWAGLDLLALVATTVYFAAWYDRFFTPARLNVAAVVVVVRLLSLHAIALLPAVLTGRRPLASGYAVVGLSAALAVWAEYDMLFSTHRYVLAGGIAGLGLLYAAAGWMRSTHPDAQEHEGSTLYALALAALATFIPTVLSGRAVPPAWAFAGAALVFAGRRAGRKLLIGGGFVMIVLGLGALVDEFPMHSKSFVPFMNGDFLAFAAPLVALALAGWALARNSESDGKPGVAVIVLAAWLATPLIPLEWLHHFDLSSAAYDGPLHELRFGSIAITLAAYGAALGWFARREEASWKLLAMGPLGVALLVGLASVFLAHDSPFNPFVNIVFVGHFAVAAALAFTGWREGGRLSGGLFIAATWFGCLAIAMEWVDYANENPLPGGRSNAETLYSSVTFSLAACAAALGWFARREEPVWKVLPLAPLAGAGLVALASVFVGHTGPFTPAANPVFLGELAAMGALVFVGVRMGGLARPGLGLAALVLLFAAITGEIYEYGQHQEVARGGREAAEFRAQVSISVAWALYAAACLGMGFVRDLKHLRWFGLGVFVLALAKVVLFDLSELDTLYRIGSFLGLGILMVGASFLYLRLRSAAEGADEDPTQPEG